MSGMKSAYELAQERLNQGSAASNYKLTPKQKKQLAELEQIYTAKIAGRELAAQEQIRSDRFQGDEEKAQKLQAALTAEIQNLRAEKEEKKQAVRTTNK